MSRRGPPAQAGNHGPVVEGTLLRAATPLRRSSTPPLTSSLLEQRNRLSTSAVPVFSETDDTLPHRLPMRRSIEATSDSTAHPRSARTATVVGLATVVAICALVATFRLGINGDVQYVLGGLATHGTDDPLGFVRTFTHRPVAYRGILDVILTIGSLVSVPADDPARFEGAARLIGIAIAGMSGLVVWLGLRRRTDALVAAGAGLGVGTSLVLAPTFDFLQAEWFAAAFAAAAIAIAVGTHRPWVGPALAGILLALAVAVKLSTVALAPAAVLLIAAMDRRRAAMTIGAGVVAGTVWLALSFAIRSEWQWLQDMIASNALPSLVAGLSPERIGDILEVVGSKVAVTPILVTVPASIALLAAHRPRGATLAAVLTAAVLLTLVPPVLQTPSRLYNLASAHVLAAGLLGAAVGRWWRLTGTIPWVVLVPLASCVVVSIAALTSAPEWLAVHRYEVMAFAAVAAVLGLVATSMLVAQSRGLSPQPAGGPRILAGIAIVVTLMYLPTVVPAAAWALNPVQTPHSNSGWAEFAGERASALRSLSATLEADDEVLYFAHGTAPYGLGVPTPCRYPSPLFLRLSLFLDNVAGLRSYADNLRCLKESEVDALLLEPRWMGMGRQPPAVRKVVRNRFDCAEGIVMGDYVLCPRR